MFKFSGNMHRTQHNPARDVRSPSPAGLRQAVRLLRGADEENQRRFFMAKPQTSYQKTSSEPPAESCFISMMQKIFKIYWLPQAIGLKNSKVIGLGNRVFASTANGASVSNGQPTRRRMLKLWIITDERKEI